MGARSGFVPFFAAKIAAQIEAQLPPGFLQSTQKVAQSGPKNSETPAHTDPALAPSIVVSWRGLKLTGHRGVPSSPFGQRDKP